MRARAILETMRIKGTVKNGVVAVDLPDGTAVTVVVEEMPVERCQLDAHGRLIMTPELEADLAEAEAEADRSEGRPWRDVLADMQRRR